MKNLLENGIYSENCITDFPPITYPTQASLLTGTYTGDYKKELCHGIPLVNWMNRETAPPSLRSYASKKMEIYKLNDDLGNNCKTFLEMIKDGNTSSIAQYISRGTDYFFPERKSKLAMYYLFLKYYPSVKRRMIRANSMIVQKLIETFKNPKKFFDVKEPPIASLIWFFSSDLLMHAYGFDSMIYKLNLIHIDRVIGVLINSLKRMGYLNDTAIAITSDHGNYKAKKLGNLTKFFNQHCLTHYHPLKNIKGNMNIAEYSGVGFVNFKGINDLGINKYWSRPTIKELKKYGPKKANLLEVLLKIDGSHLLYYRDDNNTHNKGTIYLKKKDKSTGKILTGKIEYQGIGMDYRTRYIIEHDNKDIFDFINDNLACKLLDNKFHTTQEWLEATHHINYPMFPDLIPRHFKNPRSPDIIISNDGTTMFNIHHGKQTGKSLYNHDIGLKKCMIVPLLIGGSSEVPHKHVSYCKITDIIPTLLKLLRKKPHKSMVGNCLF